MKQQWNPTRKTMERSRCKETWDRDLDLESPNSLERVHTKVNSSFEQWRKGKKTKGKSRKH
jgi:Ni/Co efflux regulator RcnB